VTEQVADAIIGVAGIVGTLGGVWLGQWLEARRESRHLFADDKRQIYSRFLRNVGLAQREIRRQLEQTGSFDPKAWRESSEPLTAVQLAFAELRIVAGQRVISAAKDVDEANRHYIDAATNAAAANADPTAAHGEVADSFARAIQSLGDALDAFVAEARRDLAADD
jgi:hypothetical protein